MYPSTLIDGVLAALRAESGGVALTDERGDVSRGELLAASGRLAFALLKSGVRRGDRLLLGLPPDRRHVTLLLAALRLGVVVVPLHPKAKLRELRHVLWDAGPRLAAADEPLADLVRTSAAAVRLLDPEALLAEPLEDAGVELSHDHAGVTAEKADEALILYTSGTTGKPKGAVHTQGSLAANVAALCEAWAIGPSDRLLHALPLHHLHGLVVGLLGSLFGGAAVELLPGFDAAAVVARLAAARATLFFGVPAMYAQLVDAAAASRAAEPDGRSWLSMRLFVCGSAPLPPALKRDFERRFGHSLLERYGTSETGIALSQEVAGARPAGSVGKPLPTVEARVEGEGEEGELLIRGPSLFRGYHEDEAATATAMSEGWYRTGDLVRRAADGAFTILGRLATDVFKVKGHRVGALEIEAALAEHPGVAEVAVVSAPDPEAGAAGGEVAVAFVRPRDGALTRESLRLHAERTLAPYQVPRRIELVADLPRTGPGKVDRAALRALAREY